MGQPRDEVIDIAAAERTQAPDEPSRDDRPPVRADRLQAEHSHLLRLSLDLQLDALLFTLGAAAAQEPAPVEGTGAGSASPLSAGTRWVPPWRRWLDEDLEVARGLAAITLAVDSSLPSTLGSPATHEDPKRIVGNLLARYEAMCGLLTDLVQREESRAQRRDETHVWLPGVRRALLQARRRAEELRLQAEMLARAAGSPPADRSAGSPPGVADRPQERRSYLPGELLG